MAKEILTLEQVEQEIARLKQSEHVKLAMKEQRVKVDKRRKYLANLCWLEKRGKQLAESGITFDNIEAVYNGDDEGGEV